MKRRLAMLRMAVRNAATPYRLDDVLLALGDIESRLERVSPSTSINDAEFKVFSQFGEDGVIQYLINRVKVPQTSFVEIGVESYQESNTRFLALHDNWSGLVVDGNRQHIDFISRTDIGWRVDITPVQAFVTRDNINELLTENGFEGDIGLLSIDVDGMDYWLIDALKVARPAIMIMEYNSLFGPTRKVTVPYAPDFVIRDAHWSGQYYGASLAALEDLAKSRGYSLVGATNNAVNCFFVRDDLLGEIPARTAAECWKASRFLTTTDAEGKLLRVHKHADRLHMIRDLDLLDLDTNEVRTIADIYDA